MKDVLPTAQRLLAEGRILEGIVTSTGPDGGTNISPMGPLVDDAITSLLLRPFQTSTTYANLKRTGVGVFHVTDDVELLARAAVGQLDEQPALVPAMALEGWVLRDACRWYEFEVESIDDSQPRSGILTRVVMQGRGRDFFGFNRAKHAVVEAAILATRVEFLPHDQIQAEMERLAVLVAKTAGPPERRAFAFLQGYIQEAIGARQID